MSPRSPPAADRAGVDPADTHVDLAGDVALGRMGFVLHQSVVIGADLIVDFGSLKVDREERPDIDQM